MDPLDISLRTSIDIDPNFEPQTRPRSNTWPLPRPDNFDTDCEDKSVIQATILEQGGNGEHVDQAPKKSSSRRNAWGNMSYADLITQAIQSSPEKRLTLAQIYEWMVHNVPYFKDKGDSNSSAGWKNSIRHNLSLHNRFMRVQNEGTGKSSWWMINPDARPGKPSRRRATSMETQKYEKKRGRVKKKVEALRNGLDATPSPSSSVSEGLDMFPDSPVHHSFQLSPDFRPRASSNASSCSRLSPIPAVETDMHGDEVPPLSPIRWNSDLDNAGSLSGLYSSGGPSVSALDRYSADQLVDTLTDSMKIGGDNGYLGDCGIRSSPSGQISPAVGPMNSTGYSMDSYAPPFYGSRGNGEFRPYHSSVPDSTALTPLCQKMQSQQRSPQQQVIETGMNGNSNSYTLTSLQTLSPAQSTQSISPTHNLDSLQQTSAYGSPRPSPHSIRNSYCPSLDRRQDNTLRVSLVPKESHSDRCSPMMPPSIAPVLPPTAPSTPAPSSNTSTSLSSTASQVMGHLLSLNNSLPNDLDLNFDTLQGGLECDVDQVISHELSVDGNLDFNFDPSNAMNSSSTPVSNVAHPTKMTSAAVNRTWVH